MINVVYDCDPGIDDAVAILLALKSNECKLRAITCVAGNVTSEAGIRNVVKLFYLIGKDWLKNNDPPLAKGSSRPLLREFDPEIGKYMHGQDGLGNTEELFEKFQIPDTIYSKYQAIDLITSKILESKEPTTLVATGPLTNIARAINREPRIRDNLKNLIIMGGALNARDNITHVAEFNVYTDPEAARMVFQSGLPILLVPLDLTKKNLLKKDDISEFRGIDNPVIQFLHRASSHYMRMTRIRDGLNEDACYLHDALAMGIAINKNLMKTIRREKLCIDVETKKESNLGRTFIDRRSIPESKKYSPIEVCLDIDFQEFKKLLVETILD